MTRGEVTRPARPANCTPHLYLNLSKKQCVTGKQQASRIEGRLCAKQGRPRVDSSLRLQSQGLRASNALSIRLLGLLSTLKITPVRLDLRLAHTRLQDLTTTSCTAAKACSKICDLLCTDLPPPGSQVKTTWGREGQGRGWSSARPIVCYQCPHSFDHPQGLDLRAESAR